MDWMQAVLLGVVEGLTEFLPISSTAHLTLTTKLLGLEDTTFQKTFEIVIQPGAVLAVVLLYWHKFLVEWRVLLRVALAFLPTALIGVVVADYVKRNLLNNLPVTLSALAIGGVILILFELLHREKPDAADNLANLPYWKCLVIGVCQTLAFIPGVSRAAATILGGLALGMTRKSAVEFSFLLAVPTLAAASAKALYDMWKENRGLSQEHTDLLLIGFGVSFVVAVLTVKLLLRVLRTHLFIGFGVYRILLVAVWLLLVKY